MIDAEDIYAKIFSAFDKNRHMMLHPQYPDEVLTKRLPLLRKIPLHFAENYVMHLVVNSSGVWPQRLLRIGTHCAEDADRLYARVMLAARRLQAPICGESYSFGWYGEGTVLASQAKMLFGSQSGIEHMLEPVWKGFFFAAINLAADDPLDAPDIEAMGDDPLQVGTTPPGMVCTKDIFQTSIHVMHMSDEVMGHCLERMQQSKVVFISCDSDVALTTLRKAARARLSLYATDLAPCSEWRFHLPRAEKISHGREPENRVLLDGVVYQEVLGC